MGCDGGTIPTRDELVRLKKKPEQKDKDADRAAKWQHCAITQEPLQQPIVACQLGRLYKKESILEFLLDKSKFECAASFDHIKSLKDVKELNLTNNPASYKPKPETGDGYVDRQIAQFICPITGLEMSGRYKFSYLLGCGCVFSDRALKEVKSDTCNKCGRTYTDGDTVVLNGSDEEVEELRRKMEQRKLQAKLDKKAKKKHKLETATSSTVVDQPSSSKQARLEDTPSSSKDTPSSSKLTNGVAAVKSKLGPKVPDHKAKLANGKATDRVVKPQSIQNDPNASQVYKSLFTSSEKCKSQPKAHWVTHNPCYY